MAAGMIVADEIEFGVGVWLALFIIALALSGFYLRRKYLRWRTLAIALLSFSSGLLIYSGWQSIVEYRSINIEQRKACGTVYHHHRSKAGNAIVYLQLAGSYRTNRALGIIIDKEADIRVGDTIAFNTPLIRIQEPANVFEFDQASYYNTLGITHRVFLHAGDFSISPVLTERWSYSEPLRNATISKVDHYLPSSRSASILYAMLFGERTHLASETQRIYSASGAMHILAISGLHIGIIASLLLLLLGDPSRHQRKWIALATGTIIIAILWLYVWLVGMPASASRAAGMFTIYVIGGIIRRRSHPLNILGATGIIALATNPMIINAVGFQLSYLALIGIVTVGLPLYRVLNFRNKLLGYFWATVAISIGAQFFLLPLLAYYFNEIATMSIVSSLFAIPAAYVIVCTGILLTAASICTMPVATWLGLFIDKIIQVLTQGLTAISNMSWSTLPGIYLTGTEVITLLILLSIISLRVATGQTFWLKFMVPLSVIFLVIHTSAFSLKRNATSITFYSAGDRPAFEIIQKGVSYHYGFDHLNAYDSADAVLHRLSAYISEEQHLQIDQPLSKLVGCQVDTNRYTINPQQLPLKINIK